MVSSITLHSSAPVVTVRIHGYDKSHPTLLYPVAISCRCVYLLPQQLIFPTGLISVSSHIILSDVQWVSISSPASTDCPHAAGTPEGCFSLSLSLVCRPVVFTPNTPSPGRWPVGCQPQMVNYLLSEPRSPPRGPRQHSAPIRGSLLNFLPSPPGCPTTWLITIHAAANPAEARHQYSCLQNNIN